MCMLQLLLKLKMSKNELISSKFAYFIVHCLTINSAVLLNQKLLVVASDSSFNSWFSFVLHIQ